MKQNILSLGNGEVSPKFFNRVDLDFFNISCSKMENFIPYSFSGVTKRAGFEYLGTIDDDAIHKKGKLFFFPISQDEWYILVFTNSSLKIFDKNYQVVATKTSPYKFSYPIFDNDLKFYCEQGVGYLFHKNYKVRTLSKVSGVWTLEILTYISPNTYPFITWGTNSLNNPSGENNKFYTTSLTTWQQRMVHGLFKYVSLSKINILNDFNSSIPLTLTDALTYELYDNQLYSINWMLPNKDFIIIGSNSGIYTLKKPIDDVLLEISKHSNIGSCDIIPTYINENLLYIGLSKKQIYDFSYFYENDGYKNIEVSLKAEHLFQKNIIKEAIYQKTSNIQWFIREDGVLIGLTYIKDLNISAFHRHTTQGFFEDIIVDGNDELVALVRREINNKECLYLEKKPLEKVFNDDVIEDVYLDCSILNEGTEVSLSFADIIDKTFIDYIGLSFKEAFFTNIENETISGLSFLEGKNIVVSTDDIYIDNLFVVDGEVVGPKGKKRRIGLVYNSEIETFPLININNIGNKNKIVTANIFFENTKGGIVGKYYKGNYEVSTRLDMTELINNWEKINISSGLDNFNTIFIKQPDGLPMTILTLIVELN